MNFKKGFTLIELLISLAIMTLIGFILFSSLLKFKDNQSLSKDTETIVSVLREARNLTLNSKNSSVYGVHFSTTTVTLFTGATYTIATTTNKIYLLTNSDNILTITLIGGGNDIVFKRLSGETSQSGTILVSSPRLSRTKTVTIYKTGVIETQ